MTRASRVAIIVGLAMMGVLILARLLFPMQLYETTKRFDLWRHGVREFHAEDMTGLERDFCETPEHSPEHSPESSPENSNESSNDPEARGCVCVALIHGLGDEAATWNKQLEAPKREWVRPVKLFAPEIPHNQRFVPGDSPKDYRVRNQAAWIASRLAPLCPSWVVVGNSWGAWEAAWIALDGKLPVQKLILMDGVGIRDSDIPKAIHLFSEPTVANMHELLSRIYYKEPHLPEIAWKRASEVTAQAHLGEIIDAQTPDEFLDARLGTLRLPTLVLWGAADRLIPDKVGKEFHAEIPGSIFREVPKCGHLPQKECSGDVIGAINDMLRIGKM